MSSVEQRRDTLVQHLAATMPDIPVRAAHGSPHVPKRPREITVAWIGSDASPDGEGQGAHADRWSIRIIDHAVDANPRFAATIAALRAALTATRLDAAGSPLRESLTREVRSDNRTIALESQWIEHRPRQGHAPPVLAELQQHLGQVASTASPGENATVDFSSPIEGAEQGDLAVAVIDNTHKLIGSVIGTAATTITIDELALTLTAGTEIIVLKNWTKLPASPVAPWGEERHAAHDPVLAIDGSIHTVWRGSSRSRRAIALDPITQAEAELIAEWLANHCDGAIWFVDESGKLARAAIGATLHLARRGDGTARLAFELIAGGPA